MNRTFSIGACAAMLAAATPAVAGDIFGLWKRDDQAAHVRIAPCGARICATNVWIKDPAGQNEKVGDRLVFTIKREGEGWAGSAYDPQRKLNLSAKLKATGARMQSSGCVLGGVICKSTSWLRM